MLDFNIRRGPSTLLFSEPGVINPRLIIEEGCWYLCTDTADLFLGVYAKDENGQEFLTLKQINGNHEGVSGEVDLTGYATEQYVNNAIAAISDPVEEVKSTLTTTVLPKVEKVDEIEPTVGELKTWVENKEYLQDIDLDGYYTKSEVNTLIPNVSEFIKEIPAEYVTEEELTAKGYLTEHQSLEGYAKLTDLPSHEGLATEEYVDNAISNIEVPTKVSELKNDAEYITKNIYTYNINSNFYSEDVDLTDELVEFANRFIANEPVSLQVNFNGKVYPTTVEYVSAFKRLRITFVDIITSSKYYNNGEDYQKIGTILCEYSLICHRNTSNTAWESAKYSRVTDVNENSGEVLPSHETVQDMINRAVSNIEHPANPTKVSELENDAGYITSADIPETDLSGYYNKEEVDNIVNGIEIPSIEGLATEEFVQQEIAKIDVPEADLSGLVSAETFERELAGKANEVPFTTAKFVTKAVGGFAVGDPVKGLSIAEILAKLLELSDEIPGENPEVPEVPGEEATPEEIADYLIATETPIYSQDDQGTLVASDFANTTWTEEEAAVQMNGVSTFYQIVDDTGAVIESGYQEATTYNEVDWLTVALPNTVTSFRIEKYDGLRNNWFPVEFEMEKAASQTIEGYTIWTVPEKYEVMAGSTLRFIIE